MASDDKKVLSLHAYVDNGVIIVNKVPSDDQSRNVSISTKYGKCYLRFYNGINKDFSVWITTDSYQALMNAKSPQEEKRVVDLLLLTLARNPKRKDQNRRLIQYMLIPSIPKPQKMPGLKTQKIAGM